MTVSTQAGAEGPDRAEIISNIKNLALGAKGLDALMDEARTCEVGIFARAFVEAFANPIDDDKKKILGWLGRLEESDQNINLKLRIAAEYARIERDIAVAILGNLCANMRRKGKPIPGKKFLKMFREVMMTGREGCLWSLLPARGVHADAIAACAVAVSTVNNKKAESGFSDELVEKALRWYVAQDTPPKLPSRLEENLIKAIKGIKFSGTLQMPSQKLSLMPPAITEAITERGIVEKSAASQDSVLGPAAESLIHESTASEAKASLGNALSPLPSSLGVEGRSHLATREQPKAFDPYEALREVGRHIKKIEQETGNRIAALKSEVNRLQLAAERLDAEHKDVIFKRDALIRNNENLSHALEDKALAITDKEARLRSLEETLLQTRREKEALAASLEEERIKHKDVVENLNEMVTLESKTKTSELKARLASMLRLEYNQLEDLEGDQTATEREEVLANILRQMFQRLKTMGIDPSEGKNV